MRLRPPSRAADVREVLTRNARRIRPLLELLVNLDIRGVGPPNDDQRFPGSIANGTDRSSAEI